MKIALVHSYYSSRVPSGENNVVDAQAAALSAAGHEVTVVGQETDHRLRRRTYPVEAAATAATGLGPTPLSRLRSLQPDVVHVHNLFPNFGKRWLARWSGPVVATMHNYRPICAGTTLFRDGHVCRDCPTVGSSWSGVRHGCFHDSSLATLPVALGTRFARDPVLRRADVVTTLSEGMRDVYAAHGVPREKMTVLHNFIDVPADPGPGGSYWVFAGRIEKEKGLAELVRDWPPGHRLLVAGSVEEGQPVPSHPDVELLGRLAPEALRELLAGAVGLVFPSLWLEGLALVCLEAMSVGTPILTFDDIPAGRSVTELGVGSAVPRGDLRSAVVAAEGAFPDLRDHVLGVFEQNFTPTAWLPRVEAVYATAMSNG